MKIELNNILYKYTGEKYDVTNLKPYHRIALFDDKSIVIFVTLKIAKRFLDDFYRKDVVLLTPRTAVMKYSDLFECERLNKYGQRTDTKKIVLSFEKEIIESLDAKRGNTPLHIYVKNIIIKHANA